MFPVYIMAVIFTGVIGITWVDAYMKLKREQIKADSHKGNGKFAEEMALLKRKNQELQRRIENLEAIVVDTDLKLETGLDSKMTSLREDRPPQSSDKELDL